MEGMPQGVVQVHRQGEQEQRGRTTRGEEKKDRCNLASVNNRGLTPSIYPRRSRTVRVFTLRARAPRLISSDFRYAL